ncbi:MAG: twin-arginine translocase subunit TatC [bacterium]
MKSKNTEMPFLDHLEELRRRLIKCIGSVILFTFVAFPFINLVLNLLTYPNDKLEKPAEMIFLKPTGMLIVRLQIAITLGVIVSIPVLFYQFWSFIAPGLLEKEKKYFLPGLFFTTLCFLGGIAFSYFILIPIVLPFLFSMGTETINPKININDYLGFVLRIIILSGIIFELPVLSFFISRIGILTPSFLKKYRKYSIIVVLIISALITPPDPISQLLMAGPLVILYEISILVSHFGIYLKKRSDMKWEKKFDDQQKNKSPSSKSKYQG